MRRIAYFLIFVIYFAKTDGKYRFDYSYNRELEGWLKLHRVPATFKDAFFHCDLEGAMLASPMDAHHQKVMVAMLKTLNLECGIFTGIHATISKGDFESIDGVPLLEIPIQWAPDEPNNLDDQEDCTVMLLNGTLADVRCNDTYPYICYKKKSTIPVVTGCGTVDAEYHLEARTGSCYKFHRIAKTWRRAASTCRAEGGHLVIINSELEATVVKDIFAKNPRDTMKLSKDIDVSLAGFLDWGNGTNAFTEWYTVHGQSVEAAGYGIWEWGSGFPTYCQTCYCGAVKRATARLINVRCDYPYSFICEKAPDSLIKDDEM